MTEQPKTYRAMTFREWALIVICGELRSIYLQEGCRTLIGFIILSFIPIFNIAAMIWGWLSMHRVYGCKTSLIAHGIRVAIIILVLAALPINGQERP